MYVCAQERKNSRELFDHFFENFILYFCELFCLFRSSGRSPFPYLLCVRQNLVDFFRLTPNYCFWFNLGFCCQVKFDDHIFYICENLFSTLSKCFYFFHLNRQVFGIFLATTWELFWLLESFRMTFRELWVTLQKLSGTKRIFLFPSEKSSSSSSSFLNAEPCLFVVGSRTRVKTWAGFTMNKGSFSTQRGSKGRSAGLGVAKV